MERLCEKYNKEVVPAMVKKFGYKSVMAVPRLSKIVVNSGFGKNIASKGSGEREKIEEYVAQSIETITGQKPSLRKAKKSIAAFKLRQGMVVGVSCTLRKQKMYDFLEKLIWVVLPRSRDFRGINMKAMTDQGDITVGFKEYVPFFELKVEKEKGIFGLELTISTTAKTKEEGTELLRLLGFPFKQQ
ncbi:MAG: 50S ribosomal protein L5 [Candidatus Pacebacteria bacterium]|nr:50S ribosomal protein L5 [Candidatus Paceibacterota bacterium]